MLRIRWRREEVVRGLAGEALEPALRVLDRSRRPGRRERVERPPERPPVARLAGPHVGAVGLDPRPERDVVVGQRGDEERQLIGRGGHVGIGEDDQVGGRGQHPRPDRGALAAVRDAQDAQARAVRGPSPSPPGRASTIAAVPSVLPSSTTRTSIRCGSAAAPGLPSRATSPRRRR